MLGGFIWVIGDVFQQYAAKYVGISRGIPLSNTNQLWGMLWGIFVFGELRGSGASTYMQVIGGSLLMMLGVGSHCLFFRRRQRAGAMEASRTPRIPALRHRRRLCRRPHAGKADVAGETRPPRTSAGLGSGCRRHNYLPGTCGYGASSHDVIALGASRPFGHGDAGPVSILWPYTLANHPLQLINCESIIQG